ncbi:MAG: type IX secretion system membrane protein PorP/SprF [Bacteroidota bacterium]|nr:type IX secretion system membrane protein PorP/SprF [Bacteroidota bacterium]
MKKLAVAFFCLIGFGAFAQQAVQFTQYYNNRLFYNPGVAGNSGSICLNGTHRSQWVGFDNAPTTQNFNAEIPLKILHGGVGLSITNDRIGFFQDVTASLMYAYQMELAGGLLGIGVQVDFNSKGLTSGEWITPDGTLTDISLANFGENTFAIDPAFGAYFSHPKFWAGISVTRLLATQSELKNTIGSVTQFMGDRALIVMGGYNYMLPSSNWEFRPSAMIKNSLGSGALQADINVNALYNNKVSAGLGYRLDDAISLMVGYNILPSLRLSYSYDITTSQLSTVSSGSHEIYVGYCFKIEIPPRPKGSYRNPVFL